MSVRSEFDRHLLCCVDFLEASDSEAAYAWATRLLEARAISRDNLDTAATRVLAFASATPSLEAIEFASSAESDAFREVCEPMLEISRAITGIRADPASDG
jgi:hypothetical protein